MFNYSPKFFEKTIKVSIKPPHISKKTENLLLCGFLKGFHIHIFNPYPKWNCKWKTTLFSLQATGADKFKFPISKFSENKISFEAYAKTNTMECFLHLLHHRKRDLP